MKLPLNVLRDTASLRAEVDADGVVGIGTLTRRFGYPAHVIRAALDHYGLCTSVITVRAVHSRVTTDQPYRIAHRHPLSPQRPTEPAHIASIAEVRWLTGAPRDEWRLAQQRESNDTYGTTTPDAYWRRASGQEIDIEYDRGTYASPTLRSKLTATVLRRRTYLYTRAIPDRLLALQRELRGIEAEMRRGGVHDLPPINLILQRVYWHVGSEAER